MEGSTRLAGCTGECVPIIVCSDGRNVFMAEGGTRAGRGRWGTNESGGRGIYSGCGLKGDGEARQGKSDSEKEA